MNFKDQESAVKLRGAYYTPEPVARFLSRWVLHRTPGKVLEPSCGDGAFIRAFNQLHEHTIRFTAIELVAEEAAKAREAAATNRFLDSEIHCGDFLKWALNQLEHAAAFDAVVGNPPYIRYQYLENQAQQLSESLFHRYQLAFTRHTNAWVPFVMASIGLLAPGGRLAMVIPAEILHVLHANSLRKFLLSKCSRILIIDPTELLFEEALQGTVLLMAEKKADPVAQPHGIAVVAEANNGFLERDPECVFQTANYVSGDLLNGKWMKSLLTPKELAIFEGARRLSSVHPFRQIATVDVGIVTGANKFFLVDNDTAARHGLTEYARPMFGRSEHCPGVIYDREIHRANQERGLPTNFIMFGSTPMEALSEQAQAYVRLGEEQNLHTRYKCRIRSPWYSIPSVYATPICMLKRSHHYPRLILNTAAAYTTDTAYRIRPIAPEVTAGALVFAFVNSLTALTAELEGRHYGGGVLELVPSEIEKLLVPVGQPFGFDLRSLDAQVRAGADADLLLARQDETVLGAAGLSKRECETIHDAWRRIRSRRHRKVVEPDEGEE